MTSTQSRSFGATLEDLARDIVDACRRAVRAIAVMPWPAMLACCIALAFVISVLPLALFLFVLFMGIKVIIGAFVVDHRRTYRDHHGEK
jgi:fatty acid desaturase